MRTPILLAVALSLIACGSTGPSPIVETSTHIMTAKIDGQPWSASGSMVTARFKADTLGFSREIITNDLSPVAQAIIISEIDAQHARGSFYFTAQKPATPGLPTVGVVVTDGTFNVEF
jgi:hypothetical protein